MAHQEVGQAGKKACIVDGLAQHVRLKTGESQKARQHIWFASKPAKYGDRRFMSICRPDVTVFCTVRHLFTEVTYFSTKSGYRTVPRGIMESVL